MASIKQIWQLKDLLEGQCTQNFRMDGMMRKMENSAELVVELDASSAQVTGISIQISRSECMVME